MWFVCFVAAVLFPISLFEHVKCRPAFPICLITLPLPLSHSLYPTIRKGPSSSSGGSSSRTITRPTKSSVSNPTKKRTPPPTTSTSTTTTSRGAVVVGFHGRVTRTRDHVTTRTRELLAAPSTVTSSLLPFVSSQSAIVNPFLPPPPSYVPAQRQLIATATKARSRDESPVSDDDEDAAVTPQSIASTVISPSMYGSPYSNTPNHERASLDLGSPQQQHIVQQPLPVRAAPPKRQLSAFALPLSLNTTASVDSLLQDESVRDAVALVMASPSPRQNDSTSSFHALLTNSRSVESMSSPSGCSEVMSPTTALATQEIAQNIQALAADLLAKEQHESSPSNRF